MVSNSLKERLNQFIKARPYIELKAGNPLVPHKQIIDILRQADFALLPYQPNLSTDNCIPTKLYEALALKIPMLIQNNVLWEEVCAPYQAGIFIDFKNFNPKNVYQQLNEFHFYKKNPGKEVLWETEEKKLMNFVSELFLNKNSPEFYNRFSDTLLKLFSLGDHKKLFNSENK